MTPTQRAYVIIRRLSEAATSPVLRAELEAAMELLREADPENDPGPVE
jgi:hypothetical protein